MSLPKPKGAQVDGLQFNCMAAIDRPKLLAWFKDNGFSQVEF